MQSAGGLERNLLALAISAADLRGQVVLAPIESVSVIILPSINISFLAVRPARTPARPPIVVIRTLAPSERRASVRLLINSSESLLHPPLRDPPWREWGRVGRGTEAAPNNLDRADPVPRGALDSC